MSVHLWHFKITKGRMEPDQGASKLLHREIIVMHSYAIREPVKTEGSKEHETKQANLLVQGSTC